MAVVMTKTIIHSAIDGYTYHCLELLNTDNNKTLHISLRPSENIIASNQPVGHVYYYLHNNVPKIAFVCKQGDLHYANPTSYASDSSEPAGTLKGGIDGNGFPKLYLWGAGKQSKYYAVQGH